MTFTICKNVIYAANNPNHCYAGDLLMPLANSRCEHKVAYNSQILEDYQQNATDIVRSWISIMAAQQRFKQIECSQANDNIFINTCQNRYDKILIVNQKEDFQMTDLEGLNVLETNEAINQYLTNNGTTINCTGNYAQISTGDSATNRQGGIL